MGWWGVNRGTEPLTNSPTHNPHTHPMPFGTSRALLDFAATRGAAAAMTHDAARLLCLDAHAATEDQPFGPDNLVFRVGGKMFAILSLDAMPPALSLKADPEACAERRESFQSVGPGYHLNKTHWNTVVLDGEVGTDELRRWIGESHALIRASLTRKLREAL